MCRANRYAGRIQSFGYPVHAERAFVCIPFGMDETSVVRARGQACFTSDAKIVVHLYCVPQHFHMTGARGTTMHTWWIVTVIAPFTSDFLIQVGKDTVGLRDDPVATKSFRNIVLCFAGHNAIHAANALSGVYHHAESCHGLHLQLQ